jgi:hypothetical protein
MFEFASTIVDELAANLLSAVLFPIPILDEPTRLCLSSKACYIYALLCILVLPL